MLLPNNDSQCSFALQSDNKMQLQKSPWTLWPIKWWDTDTRLPCFQEKSPCRGKTLHRKVKSKNVVCLLCYDRMIFSQNRMRRSKNKKKKQLTFLIYDPHVSLNQNISWYFKIFLLDSYKNVCICTQAIQKTNYEDTYEALCYRCHSSLELQLYIHPVLAHLILKSWVKVNKADG